MRWEVEVVLPAETTIAPWMHVRCEWLSTTRRGKRGARRIGRVAGDAASRIEKRAQVTHPRLGTTTGLGVASARVERVRAPGDHLTLVGQRLLQKTNRRMIDQRIGPVDVRAVGSRQRRVSDAVESREQLDRVAGTEQLLEKCIECRIRCRIQTRCGIAHLGDARPKGVGMADVEPLMECEAALHLPLGRGGEV